MEYHMLPETARRMLNKYEVALETGAEALTQEQPVPRPGYWIVRPMINLNGMSAGVRVKWAMPGEYICEAGEFAQPYNRLTQFSVDADIQLIGRNDLGCFRTSSVRIRHVAMGWSELSWTGIARFKLWDNSEYALERFQNTPGHAMFCDLDKPRASFVKYLTHLASQWKIGHEEDVVTVPVNIEFLPDGTVIEMHWRHSSDPKNYDWLFPVFGSAGADGKRPHKDAVFIKDRDGERAGFWGLNAP